MKNDHSDSTESGERFPLVRFTGGLLIACALCFPFAYAFDLAIAQAMSDDRLPGDFRKSIELSEFFAHAFGISIIVISIIVLWPEQRRRVPRLIAFPAVAGIAANIGKALVARQRPITYEGDLPTAIGETWAGWVPVVFMSDEFSYPIQAFPSGHTAAAFGLAIGLCWLIPRGKWWFLWLASLAGLQRIVADAHWTSDVVAGAFLAIAVAMVLMYLPTVNRLFLRWENVKKAAT